MIAPKLKVLQETERFAPLTKGGFKLTMAEPLWAWFVFLSVILFMLAVDLGLSQKEERQVSVKDAAIRYGFWVTVALLFNLILWRWRGSEKALEFFTGYLVEVSLSADNIFVFAVLFNYFAVPSEHRHRVLFWGILGAITARLGFILAGTALIRKFRWFVYIFGVVVIASGIKLLRRKDQQIAPERNPVLRLTRRFLPITPTYEGQKFFTSVNGKLKATPLMLVLIVVESTDIVFATDSIPAIFSITRDPFVVFTSNVCAILGLRSLYFLLEGMMRLFRYLDKGLVVILVFTGVKMIAGEFHEIPNVVALGFVVLVLSVTIIMSLLAERKERTVTQVDPVSEKCGERKV